jgi:hypothetical protein
MQLHFLQICLQIQVCLFLCKKSRLRYYTNCNSYSVEIDKTGDNFDTPLLNKFV